MGRVVAPLGRARAPPSPSLEAAFLTLAAVTKRRRQRGSLVKAIEALRPQDIRGS